MPWKLVPPRTGKTPYWYVRGKYLGISLDKSTGASERRAAETIFRTWKRQAERGEFSQPRRDEPAAATFLSAAVAYMQSGGERQFIQPILARWGEKPLDEIDQIAIDSIAAELYPKATAQTRNRQIYTPISAILKRAGIDKKIKRPKGWRGKKSVSWLEPEQAVALFAAADSRDAEFGLFLRLLFFTGLRLGEALRIQIRHVNLARAEVYIPETKNGEARMVHLPPDLVAALANHPRGLDRPSAERLIRYHAGGRLRDILKEAMAAARLSFPRRQGGFHIFCHTYGTLMARLGADLLETGRWKDRKSSDLYVHLDAKTEARKADSLLTAKRG
ncbi:MAG: site-specific integrase [Myxococcales bacterium]|nr:MAG: site-specific integrase [Myxococcales bacterium]